MDALPASARLLVVIGALLLAACATTTRSPVAAAGVAFDRSGELGGFAQGFADSSNGRALTTDDPVRVASTSKLIVAIAVLTLVERGKLDLDADASAYLGWPLRNPAYPAQPITLRQLLSHTAGLRDRGDNYVVPLGASLRPVVEGNRAAWDPRHAPGRYFHYANLNFPLVAGIVERVTGERFDRFVHGAVFRPLELDACFNWPTCSDNAVARAVVLTRGGAPVRDDLRGVRPPCPVLPGPDARCDLASYRLGDNGALFSPQGGLRISMRGLARIGRMLLGGGTLDGARILSPAGVAMLGSPQFDATAGAAGDPQNFYCRYGLGTQVLGSPAGRCADDPAGDGTAWIGHAGEAYGLRSGLWIDPVSGRGIAYFVTEQPDSSAADASFTPTEGAVFRRTLRLATRR